MSSTNKNDNDNDKRAGDNPDDWEFQRDEAKAAGDASFRIKKYSLAIQSYSTALSMDPDNAKILSNRSAAYLLNGEKSKSLHDAQKCVELKTMGIKGKSRLAAALQALGRWEPALAEWKAILQEDGQHAAAKKGVADCEAALEEIKKKEEAEKPEKPPTAEKEEEEDDLDAFFDDVEEAVTDVVVQKQEEAKPKATEAIKSHKKDLGTADEQIERLLAPNYKWRNLNPYLVLDIDHTASEDEVSRRYKALSLLLHPDKNRSNPQAQDAFDEVLKAKAQLKDENKVKHIQQLIEQGMQQGKAEFESQKVKGGSLQECQSKAVQRIFAQIEFKRQEVEERQRNFQQREQQQEEEELQKERDSRKFDKSWKEEGRVDKRIGNWRDFQKKKKSKV